MACSTSYFTTSSVAKNKRYIEKFEVLYCSKDPDALIDPYVIKASEWKNDIALWPPIEFGHIHRHARPVYKRKAESLQELGCF